MGDDDTIPAVVPVVADFVAQLLSVAIEEPDHPAFRLYQRAVFRITKLAPVASAHSLTFESHTCNSHWRLEVRSKNCGAEQRSLRIQDDLHRHLREHRVERRLREKRAHERTGRERRKNLRRDAAADEEPAG